MNLFAAALFALAFPSTGYIVAPPVMTVHIEAAVEAPQLQQGETFILTAYSCYDPECLTASGHRAGPGSVGVPMSGPAAYPLGTVLDVEGIGRLVVDDHCQAAKDGG